jgi:creatinine amidohydrolase/Fe(II)-dependent formamide hydrolase-like protein
VIRLAECTYREAARLARDERALVILPLGAIEQHGPHLPLLVDWLGAEELARHVTPHLERAGYKVVLAPSLPYGASPLAEAWPGTVSLSRATLKRVIVEVVGGLARHGFRRFVLANYQADPAHVRAMAEAKRALTRRDRRLRILFAGFSPEARSMAAMLDPRVLGLSRSPRPEGEWHAGELETALVLARRPDLVRRAVARRLPPVWVDFRAALRKGARRFEQIAPGGLGYFGWPAAARAVTVKRALALRGRLMAREIIRALGPADRTPVAPGPARRSRRRGAESGLAAPGLHPARTQ